MALAAGVTAAWALIILIAAVLVPQDADWRTASLGAAAVVAGPFLAAWCLRPFVPVAHRARWTPCVTLASWLALGWTWALSTVTALVAGPAALLLVVALLSGPMGGAWIATRPSAR